ncbi:purine-nucleoside phosphorylase [bacterium]|nr:purine-nucleoside phosphorylase [bacterium]
MSHSSPELVQIEEAAASIVGVFGQIPKTLVVAGSGLGGFTATLTETREASYDKLRHFPVSTVVGHAGKLVLGKADGHPVIVMSGRKHLYEGVDPKLAVLPLRALLKAGVKTVILSNAAGCVNPRFSTGEMMLITDHVNNMMKNPLIGPNFPELGARFPDMSEPYSRRLQKLALQCAAEKGIVLREGVYIANLGPTFETQAEVMMFRMMGDAVGMSTVPETIAAIHAGAEVLGISLLTNSHVERASTVTTHEEVMEIGRQAADRFNRLITAIIAKL